MLTVALPTGRVMEDARRLLRELGLPTEALGQCGRELVVDEGEVRYLLAKPTDVPVYVLWGAADLALAESLDLYNTPTFYINGRQIIGERPLAVLRKIVDEELQQKGK